MRFVLLILLVIIPLPDSADAQADCGYMLNIYVQDISGNPIKHAKARYAGSKMNYSENLRSYRYFRLLLPTEVAKGRLEISAKGFQPLKTDFEYRCGDGFFRARLKKNRSDESASLVSLLTLRGFVSDKNGAAVVGAKVIATNSSGERIEGETNENGIYVLGIFPGPNNIEFEKTGFRKAVTQDPLSGNSIFNIELEPEETEPCVPEGGWDRLNLTTRYRSKH